MKRKQTLKNARDNATGAESVPKRRRSGLIAGSLAAVALAGAGAWRFQRINALPDMAIPAPTMPAPNAYDDYVRATRLAVHEIGDGYQAGEPDADQGGAKTTRRGGPIPPVNARLRLVALNDNAVRALHHGFTHAYRQPPDRSPTGSTLFHYRARTRTLARVLAFSSRAWADAGRADRASQYGVDGVRFGSDLPRGGDVMTWFGGCACETLAREPLWEIAPSCDAPAARTAAHRLEEIERNRSSLSDALREEKRLGTIRLRTTFERAGVNQIAKQIAEERGAMTGSATSGSGSGVGSAVLSPFTVGTIGAQILVKGRRRILEDNAAYMDRVIAVSRLPYGAHVPLPTPPPDPINGQFIFNVWGPLFLADAEQRMLTRLLAVRFALQAYRLERGAYPAALGDLVHTGYLRAVPEDPFALPRASATRLAPLGYRRAGGGAGGFVLYSVGPDSRDDGGKPINNPYVAGPNKGRQINRVQFGAKGDFVVGVNAY